MRPEEQWQWVLVEQTLTGSEEEDSIGGRIPGNPPQLPVTDATVSVTNLGMPTDPCGMVFFTERPADPRLETSDGLYWGPQGCPTMRTGDTLLLTVETVQGEIVTGTTEVPGAEAMLLSVAGETITVPGPTVTMNRDSDTLVAEVVVSAGRAIQLEVGSPDSLGVLTRPFAMFVDSTAITLPGDLPNFLLGILGEEDTTSVDDIEPIFSAGRYYNATVALFDDRYFDYARSGNVPLSGRGFINNLTGGMGVFASMVAATNRLKVVGDVDDQREGIYRMAGEVAGTSVDADLEIYVAAAGEDSTSLSAFVQGDWVFGAIETSAQGQFGGDTIEFVFYQRLPEPDTSVAVYLVRGNFGSGSMFTADVLDRSLNPLGSVAVTRRSEL
jgi:hypothetical protein